MLRMESQWHPHGMLQVPEENRVEGSRPGLLALATLARLAEEPAGETMATSLQRPWPPGVLFPSSAMDLDRLVAARLQMTLVCQDWLYADVLWGWCEQQPVITQSYL